VQQGSLDKAWPEIAQRVAVEKPANQVDLVRIAVEERGHKALPQWLAAKEQVGSSFALGAAIIAGFLHPFWYARGQALSFVAEKHVPEAADLFVRLGDVAPRLHSELPDSSRGLIKGGESASGLIPPERIEAVDRLLRRMEEMPGTGGRTLLQTAFDADGLASLRAALAYCRVKKLGMIEASDIVVPFSGESLTEIKNMRAPFLGKMAP